eukprot:scaffold19459_cov58-Attheya_sp.AAC.3
MAESAMTSELYEISLLLLKFSPSFLTMLIATFRFICGSKRTVRTWDYQVVYNYKMRKVYQSHRSHRGMLEGDTTYCDAAAAAVAHCDHEN